MILMSKFLRMLFPWVEKQEDIKNPISITKSMNSSGVISDLVVEYNSMEQVVITFTPVKALTEENLQERPPKR